MILIEYNSIGGNIMTIGERFSSIRKHNNISANKLAKALNVDPSTISKIENDSSMPSIQLLQKFCDYFDMSFSAFFRPLDKNYCIKETESVYNIDLLKPELKELIESVKDLSPEQIIKLTEFIKSMK